MSDQQNELGRPVGQLDDSVVERLTSEVSSLKLELATLSSAIRELQYQQSGRRTPVPAKVITISPPSRPSIAPAAIVVVVAAGLLSWQVIGTPRSDRLMAQASRPAPPAPRPIERSPRLELHAPADAEPPITPLVIPTIYKGTLTVGADQPGAIVFVNRENVGTAPVRVNNLRAGAHLVWVESEGYRRWTRVVTVPAEKVTSVRASLEPEPIADR